MKTTKAYRQAMQAQRDQALRGSALAPLPGWRQVNQMKPGWTTGGAPTVSAPVRPPLSAPAAPRVTLKGEGPWGTWPFGGDTDWLKLVPALALNFGITWTMLEVFPSYLKDKLDGRTADEKSRARFKIIIWTTAAVTAVNSFLVPWFARQPRWGGNDEKK